ncbi:MAG: GSCFA domain-containing protein [Ichthyobacteriaceae bacterium]|nr:GSCFA domain-containing protein [Ichthyobacteriaceae bacterium]
MKLISEVKIYPPKKYINYNHKLLFLGSCFSGNIGNKFKDSLFNTEVNPFGVIFNPISILKLIERSIEENYFTEDDWIFRNEKWVNLDLHGELSFSNLNDAINNSNSILKRVSGFIKNADFMFLTFGTAWIYYFINNNQLVANCHKIPQKEFNKKLLTVNEIVEYATVVINKLRAVNSKLEITFTVSPVRHWADGAHNNNLSKSTLHLAINELTNIFNSEYFPSYELLIDELRDYRFFDRDLIHPNNLATDYIWEKLSDNLISKSTKIDIERVDKIISSSKHRPFNVESVAHQKFVNKMLQKLQQLQNELDYLNFTEIRNRFLIQLV